MSHDKHYTLTDTAELKHENGEVMARITMEWFHLEYADVVQLEEAKSKHFSALVELGQKRVEALGPK